MKKINWSVLVKVLLVMAMTMIGTYMMEEVYIEDMSGVIWIVGMICMTEIFVVSEIRNIVKIFKDRKSNHSEES